ncbi:MAG: aminotransferase class V-fold PLP-dependent enzyme, partial [Clostridia bacterium]|nr:aminotransferase class V-fold PLP-dependent enzyme [Clostridia bacterium]
MKGWVEALRKEFPAAVGCAYLDGAYDMGGADYMKAAANWFFDAWGESALALERGGPGRARFFAMADETRKTICQLLYGGEISNICFTHNTNEGINMAVMGFAYAPGDNIITFQDDFPSVVGPCLNAARLRGVEVRCAKTEVPGVDDIDALMALTDEHTRLIVISHVRSATGYMVDLQRLGGLCKEKGIFLIVDATQSFGSLPIKAKEWGVDGLSAAGYKCMLGGISSAFFYCSEALAEKITPVFVSYNNYTSIRPEGQGCSLTLQDGGDIRKLESGTIDVLGIAILQQGLNRIQDIGLDIIRDHISGLYEKLYRGLVDLGYEIVTPFDPKNRSAVLAVRIHGEQAAIYAHFKNNG